MTRTALAVSLLASLGFGAFAQSTASLPRFEVASIKLNTSGGGNSSNDANQGEVTYRNYTLRGIVRNAFLVDDQSLTAPDWLYDVRFDITAKVPPGVTLQQVPQMMQALLIERFKLSVHREAKSVQGFALVTAKNGAKIKPVENVGGHATNARNGNFKLERTTMDQFAENLSYQLKQPVVDQTGLAGVFTFTLTFTPDREVNAKSAQDAGGSIFTALQEQLGLKLETRKVPVEILVVDHCGKSPTEN